MVASNRLTAIPMGAATISSTRPPAPPAKVLLRLILSPPASATKVITKGKRRVQQHADVGGGGGAAPFQCRTCGRRFATFQALGGHRTSHKRPPVRAYGLDLLLGARPGKGVARAAPVMHRCGTCGQAFPTGQALGGHMRRHRPVDAAVATGTSSWSSSCLSAQNDDDESDARPTLFQFI